MNFVSHLNAQARDFWQLVNGKNWSSGLFYSCFPIDSPSRPSEEKRRDPATKWPLPGDCNVQPRATESNYSCPTHPVCTPSPTGEAMQPFKSDVMKNELGIKGDKYFSLATQAEGTAAS